MRDPNMRDELLALQQATPQLKAENERRIREMMEKDLRPAQRVAILLSALMGAGFFVGFGYAAIWSVGTRLPWEATTGFAVGSAIGLIWCALALSIARKGKMTRNRDDNAQTGLIWVFTILQFMLFFSLAPKVKDPNTAIWMMLSSLGYVIFGVAFLLVNRIEQSALKTEEQFLRMQLQMAEMNETLAAKQG